jgi:hypothetical protein
MTVCIAAVCAGGRFVTVAADRMFTVQAPVNLEFETAEQKIESLSPSCVALAAGNSAFSKEIINATAKALAGAQNPLIENVAEAVKTAYIQIRANKVREQVILPMLGPDYIRHEQFNVSIPSYLQQQPQIYQQLIMQSANVNIGCDFLVAGIDVGGARVGYIGHPGTLGWLDKLGFGAIGSGAVHATTRLSLGAQSRDTPLPTSVLAVYAAKRASEVAPGVGNETDLAVVYPDRTERCSAQVVQELDRLYRELGERSAPSLEALTELLTTGTTP